MSGGIPAPVMLRVSIYVDLIAFTGTNSVIHWSLMTKRQQKTSGLDDLIGENKLHLSYSDRCREQDDDMSPADKAKEGSDRK
jgi:hypothetical protein